VDVGGRGARLDSSRERASDQLLISWLGVRVSPGSPASRSRTSPPATGRALRLWPVRSRDNHATTPGRKITRGKPRSCLRCGATSSGGSNAPLRAPTRKRNFRRMPNECELSISGSLRPLSLRIVLCRLLGPRSGRPSSLSGVTREHYHVVRSTLDLGGPLERFRNDGRHCNESSVSRRSTPGGKLHGLVDRIRRLAWHGDAIIRIAGNHPNTPRHQFALQRRCVPPGP
jgi:hypothetical protein